MAGSAEPGMGADGGRRVMPALKVPHTFEMRPTSPTLPAGSRPDELMIDWRSLPGGTDASLYLPGINAPGVAAQAAAMYGTTAFAASDAHTLTCPARDVTYMPIPVSADSSFAGLLIVEPPGTVQRGQQFRVNFYQLTSLMAGRAEVTSTDARPVAEQTAGPQTGTSTWRRVLGTFQVMIPVVARTSILEIEERQLSVLRWILAGVDTTDRNYLTFLRYVGLYAERIATLGGNPDLIPASPTGTWPEGPGGHPGPWPPDGGLRGRRELFGKVEAVIFDHFGDFQGFVLETESGDRTTFHSHEEDVRELAIHAMAARLRTSVVPEHHDPHLVNRIILHQTPGPTHEPGQHW
jgi:hypothetical protein